MEMSSSRRLKRRKGVVSSGEVKSRSNSLDWDSPSTKTGTVKRRPLSSDCSENEINSPEKLETPVKMQHKSRITNPSIKYERPEFEIHNGKNNVKRPSRTYVQSKLKLPQEHHSKLSPSYKLSWTQFIDDQDEIHPKIKKKDSLECDPKCFNLTDTNTTNAHLIERKASGFNLVSDSDSGIASPLSPTSLYGFLVNSDKNEGCRRDFEIWIELERLRSCSCINQQTQVICEVTVAKPLDEKQQKDLKAVLMSMGKGNQKVHYTIKIDPSIVGGMIVNFGDRYVDMSTATKIKKYTELMETAT